GLAVGRDLGELVQRDGGGIEVRPQDIKIGGAHDAVAVEIPLSPPRARQSVVTLKNLKVSEVDRAVEVGVSTGESCGQHAIVFLAAGINDRLHRAEETVVGVGRVQVEVHEQVIGTGELIPRFKHTHIYLMHSGVELGLLLDLKGDTLSRGDARTPLVG